jgi:hypothetical protein
MILALALAAALGVTRLDGRPVDPFQARPGAVSPRALVFVFVDPECPVSNRYVPELNRLHARYARREIAMTVVYSSAADLETLRAHHSTYGLLVPALVDARRGLADSAGVTITPEAVVYEASGAPAGGWTLVYRGRIDDRAAGVGLWRPVPSVSDLADVLQRIDRGEALAYRETRAVGCFLRR